MSTNPNQLSLNTPVTQLLKERAYGTKKALERLGIVTINDLITFLPFRYEDRTNIVRITGLRSEVDSVIIGRVKNVSQRKSKRGVLIIQAVIEDESGKIPAVWFNQRYLLRTLRPGDEVVLYGVKKPISSMNNPFFVSKIIPRAEICPIYHTTSGLAQPTIRRLVTETLERLKDIPDLLPETLAKKLGVSQREEVLRASHQPKQLDDLTAAQTLLGQEELLVLGLQAEQALRERRTIKRTALTVPSTELRQLAESLPFALTDSQRKASWEIIQDLTKTYPMNRLLYGEVGSGKTAVALLVAAAVIKNDKQVILLCPTVALAHQQANVAEKLLQPLGINVGLLTGSTKKGHSAELLVGTHAVLQTKAINADLLIIDEQHRFGVEQRRQLIDRSPKTHLLMMTATPIPRSFAQTIFRYLDITYLSANPTHQKKIKTLRFNEESRAIIEAKIKKALEQNEPGYVICPRIDESDQTIDTLFDRPLTTVQQELVRLKKVFPKARIGAFHGRTDKKMAQEILAKFKTGQLDILVATTVVEVGIDNPAATWMLIEDADQFGLSTLHQLRGRVGRGQKQSYCYVADHARSALATERLEALCQIENGLELSELDLKLRGPGELVGLNQSGAVKLRYADWNNQAQIKAVFDLCQKIMDDGINNYPELVNRIGHELSSV